MRLHDLTLDGGAVLLSVLRQTMPPGRTEPQPYAPCKSCGVICKGRHTCEPLGLAPVVAILRAAA